MARVISDLGSARLPAISTHMSTSEHLSNKGISCGIRLERKNREKKKRDLSRKREISEQFVWLNRQYGETEAQLSRSAITPSIRADLSQDEGM